MPMGHAQILDVTELKIGLTTDRFTEAATDTLIQHHQLYYSGLLKTGGVYETRSATGRLKPYSKNKWTSQFDLDHLSDQSVLTPIRVAPVIASSPSSSTEYATCFNHFEDCWKYRDIWQLHHEVDVDFRNQSI